MFVFRDQVEGYLNSDSISIYICQTYTRTDSYITTYTNNACTPTHKSCHTHIYCSDCIFRVVLVVVRGEGGGSVVSVGCGLGWVGAGIHWTHLHVHNTYMRVLDKTSRQLLVFSLNLRTEWHMDMSLGTYIPIYHDRQCIHSIVSP